MIWAILLGTIQAITEFLPISSSAHLLISPWLFGFPRMGLAFDAALHIGTSLALLLFFWRDFWQMIQKRDKFLWLILIASIPGAAIGFFGDKLIEQYLHEGSAAILIAAVGMILMTGVIWYIDATAKLQKDLSKMTRKEAFLVGLAQALALIPGMSRSGATIAAGLAAGYTREAAARFSFLIGTPIALGAGLYKATDIVQAQPSNTELMQLIVGVVTAAVLGFVVIRWLLGYVQKHSLRVFLIYRLVFASIVIIVWFVRQ
ncbi:MAG: undecaprenyl-diphosphatase [Patescibacteria group bacterium]|nr:undecaprenyl-diphosphatase [Patescibacteria group bacterium]